MARSFVKLALAALIATFVGVGQTRAQELVPAAATFNADSSLDWLFGATPMQYAHVNEQGELKGKLARFGDDGVLRMIPNQDVTLTQAGRVLMGARTDAEGDFVFGRVKPGIYTVTASNPQNLLVLTILVGPAVSDAQPLSLVAAGPVSPDRRTAMLATLVSGAPPQMPVMIEPTAYPSGSVSGEHYRAVLDRDGSLTGNLSWTLLSRTPISFEGVVLRLTRGNQVVGEARVAGDGSFRIPSQTPGPVSVFAFGPQGFSAVGIQLVAPSATLGAAELSGAETLVNVLQGNANLGLNIALGSSQDAIGAAQQPGDSLNLPPAAPLGPGGGVAGGGGSFGGGGGGGGGLGGIGALGAIGAAAAIAASNDDDGPFVPAATSPNGS